ncbi:molybdenum cofactor guanylyltransferase [Parashewanella curva]|uniref:Molybdenum cofactor guanylyltransferase n=1 Tax=Parashewanella curva TaxID=2338552 RepID=A0A3L8PUM3_9GAMM|nr:molybdenum cofactor guanylyltransferase MobA [Parashewanella curva]RLV59016.1 molybdenum cofactor guanylyltransferase [Parashewanella curva]
MSDLSVEAVILAGGQGRRMQYQDKGLVTFQHRPLVQHVIDTIHPQVNRLMIMANRNIESYQAFGYPVFSDELSGFQGPLSGLSTALHHCQSEWLLMLPCDTPHLPSDLLEKMQLALAQDNTDIVVACDSHKEHAVIMLLKRQLKADLDDYLASGERRVMAWYRRHQYQTVEFDAKHFINCNHIDELS